MWIVGGSVNQVDFESFQEYKKAKTNMKIFLLYLEDYKGRRERKISDALFIS